jgi:opacity protein-like surface antigen
MPRLLLAAALLAASAVPALAADIYVPPPAAPAPVAVVPVTLGGFYASLHGGVDWIPDTDVVFGFSGSYYDGDFAAMTGYRVGGSLGYAFNPNLALEAEVSFAQAGLESFSSLPVSGPLDGDGSLLTGMVNLLVGHQMGAWRPYVGAGGGIAYVSLNDVSSPALADPLDDDDTTWGAQAFAGVDFSLSATTSLGARYRYQYIGETGFVDAGGDTVDIDSIQSHSVEAVLRFAFGG